MSDDQPEIAPEHDVVSAGPVARPSWAWQFPLLAVSLAAIAAAVLVRRPPPAEVDHEASIQRATEAIARADLDGAAAHLSEAAGGMATRPDLLGRYHLAVADHRAAAIQPLRTAPAGQARQVVEAYERARQDGARLDGPRRLALAEAMVAAGLGEDAIPIFASVEPTLDEGRRAEVREVRHGVIRDEVDRRRRAGAPLASLSHLLGPMLEETRSLSIDAWVTAIDARIRLETGEIDGLARGLGLAMHRLQGRVAEEPGASIDWPEFYVLLGHAYRDELAAGERARECYRLALDRLHALGPTAAEAAVSLGRLELDTVRASAGSGPGSAVDEAASRFEAVLGMADANLDQQVEAEIGLVALRLLGGDHEASLSRLDRIAGRLRHAELVSPPVRRLAVEIALEGGDRATAAASEPEQPVIELLDAASAYAAFVRDFADESAIRHRGLDLLATARERAAALLVSPILGSGDPRADRALAVMPVETRLESARRFAAAAAALDEIERELPGEHPDRFDVLWRSAVLHDKAGAVEDALGRYRRFVESQSTDAAMWPEAAYRVAAGCHALADLVGAETWYRRLLDEMAEGRDEVSEFTMRARVGLARVLLEQDTEVGLGEAEALLGDVLGGTARDAVEPSVPEYREALYQLVRLLGEQRRWPELAGRGEEWLGRYPSDLRWGEMAIRTGEALLHHADTLRPEEVGTDAGNPSLVAAREDERKRALQLAATRLQAGISELDRSEADGLDPLEARLLRSGHLHRAAVADRVGDPTSAMQFYREAERRFAGEPVAIVALISLADVAARAGDRETAGRATDRARKRLEHLHREGGRPGVSDESLGPDLLIGPGRETIDRWITAFPPGVEEGIG